MCITSGKTEYQTTKASKARRSASFERRPSRRYSRRTMQNRGENTNENDTVSHYTLFTFISITHLHTQQLESECLLCVICVYTGQLNAHEWVYNQIWWLWFCACQRLAACPSLSVYSSVSPKPWLTLFLLNSFSSLDCNPVTELAFCYRICWQTNDIMSLVFFKLFWDQLSQSIVKTNSPVTVYHYWSDRPVLWPCSTVASPLLKQQSTRNTVFNHCKIASWCIE